MVILEGNKSANCNSFDASNCRPPSRSGTQRCDALHREKVTPQKCENGTHPRGEGSENRFHYAGWEKRKTTTIKMIFLDG